MEIYIGNLPDRVKPAELRRLVNYALLPASFDELVKRVFKKADRIVHSRYDFVEKQIGEKSVRFARAIIEPDGVAMRAVQRLDRYVLRGSSLQARRYVPRNKYNDRRRQANKNLYSVNIYNRRKSDRRLHQNHNASSL